MAIEVGMALKKKERNPDNCLQQWYCMIMIWYDYYDNNIYEWFSDVENLKKILGFIIAYEIFTHEPNEDLFIAKESSKNKCNSVPIIGIGYYLDT